MAKVLKRIDGIIDKDGIEKVRFILKPSSGIIQRFNIQSKEMPQGWIKKEYPKNMVHLASVDPTMRITFVLCDFLGNPTVLTRLNSTWLIQNEYLQKENATLKTALAIAQEEQRIALENAAQVAEAHEKVRKKMVGKEQISPWVETQEEQQR